MKKLFAFVCVMMFLQNLVFAEKTPIGIKSTKNQEKQAPIFRSIIRNVTGYYDTETGKATLYFYQSIGDATVSVTDETGSVVFSQVINTATEDMLEFPLPEQVGTYMLSIVSATYEGTGEIIL